MDGATVRRQAGLLADALLAELGGTLSGGLVRLMAALTMAGASPKHGRATWQIFSRRHVLRTVA